MLSALIDKFLKEQVFKGNSKVTIDWYRHNLNSFVEWLCSNDTTADKSALTLNNFVNYGVYLRGKQKKRNGDLLSESSVVGTLRAVKVFYNFCIAQGEIEDISKSLKLPKVHHKVSEILTNKEIQTLYACFDDTMTGLRNKCFVTLMLDSGLRRSEVSRLNIEDFKANSHIIVVNGKGGKQRIVPIGETSQSLIADYIKLFRSSASPAEPLFLESRNHGRCSDNLVKQVFQDLKVKSGIDRLHPHLLRHTFATYYIADGGDLETLRLILGHANIQTTQIYLHMASDLKLQTSRHTSHIDKLYGK